MSDIQMNVTYPTTGRRLWLGTLSRARARTYSIGEFQNFQNYFLAKEKPRLCLHRGVFLELNEKNG